MRCLSCDNSLSDKESTRKFPSGHYVDLCDCCFKTIEDQVLIIEGHGTDYIKEENE